MVKNVLKKDYSYIIDHIISFSMGCMAPDSGKNTVKEHIVGGVAVGVSPKVIYAQMGENVSINVDLHNTENADDRVTVKIEGNMDRHAACAGCTGRCKCIRSGPDNCSA